MKYTNAPQLIKRSDYKQAIDIYLERVTNTPGVLSVYTMGSIEAPGLSDIDIIVIVNDDFDPEFSANLSVLDLDSRLFIHGPVIIPQSMIEDFQYIIYATGLKKLYGNESLARFSDLDIFSAKVLRFCYLIDFLESRQVQYTHATTVEEVDQRAWMARLWSLTHSEKLFLDSGLELQESDRSTLDKIRNLRSKWLSEYTFDTELFKEPLCESVQLSKNLLILALQNLYPGHHPFSGKIDSVMAGNTNFSFNESEKICNYKVATLSFMGKKTFFYSARWNPIFAEHLRCYSLIKDNNFCKKKSKKFDVLRKRALVVKKHWKWLAVSCPYAGSMSGYLSFRLSNQTIARKMIKKLLIRFFLRQLN